MVEYVIKDIFVVKTLKWFVRSLDITAFQRWRKYNSWHNSNLSFLNLLLGHVLINLTEIKHFDRFQKHAKTLLSRLR